MRSTIIAASVMLAAAYVAQTGDAAATVPQTHAVTYCQTFGDLRWPLTLLVTDDGHETFLNGTTVRNMPVVGERELVESRVLRHRPRVMHCEILSVNGNHTMVLTTRGGEEWHVVNPGIVR